MLHKFFLICFSHLCLRWNNVLYLNVGIYNVEQRRINVVYFNVDWNNVRQRQNNVVIFNTDFHNFGQRRNNVMNMTIWKKRKTSSQKQNNIFELQIKII